MLTMAIKNKAQQSQREIREINLSFRGRYHCNFHLVNGGVKKITEWFTA